MRRQPLLSGVDAQALRGWRAQAVASAQALHHQTEIDMPPISAIAFDAFGTLIQYGAQRTSPYRRLIRHRSAAPQELRSKLMTRNV